MRLPSEMQPGAPGRRVRLLLALASGLAVALGQAPFDLWPVAIPGLALLFQLIRTAGDMRQAAFLGLAAGTGHFALALFWIIEPFLVNVARHGWMAPFALIGMSAGLALFWAVAAAVVRGLGGRALAFVAAFTLVEVLRSYVLTGFPWALIGHVWIDTPLVHVASVVGHHALTLLALLAAAGLVQLLSPHRRWWGAGSLAMVGAAALWGGTVTGGGPGQGGTAQADPAGMADRPVIRMIQPNAPQHLKWDRTMIPVFFQRQIDYTAAMGLDPAQPRPDLVIWAETALSVILENAEPELEAITLAADGVPVVLGIQRFIGQRTFNSAIYLDGGGTIRAIYDKHRLVPFGEYMPFGEVLSQFGIHGMAASRGGGFSPGAGPRLMDLGGLGHALPLICYEAVFPQAILGAPDRPDFLMQITNDAWFGTYSGPYQHLAQARLRAIEQGLPMVRVANTGVSAMIDGHGRVTAALPLDTAGWLDAPLPRALPPTIYALWGELPIMLIILGLLGASVGREIRARRAK
ncbi:MAG: apolipoprotein N-acyltransferase [Paracoccaceae bacterium]|nr:apolipoprotein N-acyltransferase [Paracoccaceae bacterium]